MFTKKQLLDYYSRLPSRNVISVANHMSFYLQLPMLMWNRGLTLEDIAYDYEKDKQIIADTRLTTKDTTHVAFATMIQIAQRFVGVYNQIKNMTYDHRRHNLSWVQVSGNGVEVARSISINRTLAKMK